MKFLKPTFTGILIKRYKRFLADIKLDDETIITAHSTNTGSMKSVCDPGSRVIVSFIDDPKRKLKYTWQAIEINKTWVCINTMIPNKLVCEAICEKKIPELRDYTTIKREVKYGENSRIDIYLEQQDGTRMYIEVKNVTLKENKYAAFPDAVTERGTKHLHELINVVKAGHKAYMFYVVNRNDCQYATVAHDIDPVYAKTVKKAIDAGVGILCYQTQVTQTGVELDKPIPFKI